MSCVSIFIKVVRQGATIGTDEDGFEYAMRLPIVDRKIERDSQRKKEAYIHAYTYTIHIHTNIYIYIYTHNYRQI